MKTYEYNGITCETPKKLKFQRGKVFFMHQYCNINTRSNCNSQKLKNLLTKKQKLAKKCQLCKQAFFSYKDLFSV